MYSQNNEDDKILAYFKGRVGRLLDIGANDGITLSNSRLFIDTGWKADLVEPSPVAFVELINTLEAADSEHVVEASIYNFAITDETGVIDWWDGDWHLSKSDVSLLSSASIEHVNKWKHHKRPDGTRQKFTKTQVQSFRWEDSPLFGREYDYITIDTEGHNWTVLQQIPLDGVQALCVEWGNDEQVLNLISDYATSYGLKMAHKNFENVIFFR